MTDDPNAITTLPAGVRVVRRVQELYLWGLALIGGVGVASSVFVGLRHLGSRYHLNHVASAWQALTWYAANGELYPPLFEDGFYGGTRFAPLSILLNTVAAKISGELFTSTKVVALLAMAAVIVGLYLLIVQRGAPRAVAFFLAGGVVLTEPGFYAMTSPFRGDPAPIVLQLAALMLVAKGGTRTTRRVVIASVLCAIAVFFKLTAGFAVIAIGLVLLVQDRRQLAYFCVTWFGLVFALGSFFHIVTDGGMTENLFGVATSDLGGARSIFGAPGTINYLLHASSALTGIGVPIVLVAILRSLGRQRITLLQLAWLASLAILVVLFTDSGVAFNHLLAFEVTTAACIGELWADLAEPADGFDVPRVVMAGVLAFVAYGDFDRHVSDDLRMSMRALAPEHDFAAVDDLVRPGMKVLSEEPSLLIAQDMRPVLVDAWMITKIAKSQPEAQTALVDRVKAREFDRVILLADPASEASRAWYSHHFGWSVVDAILENYALTEVRVGLRVYERKGGSPSE